jgi:hypothetical protein
MPFSIPGYPALSRANDAHEKRLCLAAEPLESTVKHKKSAKMPDVTISLISEKL